MYHGDRCGKTRLHDASCTITGWSSVTHNRALHQKLARSLRESKVQFVVEGIWSFLGKAGGQDGRLHPPQLEQTTAVVVPPSAVVPFRSIRGLYSILPTSILVSAQIWITQNAMQKTPSPMQSNGRKTGFETRSLLRISSFLSLCRRVVRLAQT